MEITLVLCGTRDIFTLAQMNQLLIEDEGSDNGMTLHQLASRMDNLLKTGYSGYLFMGADTIIGYALVRMTATPYYIRHFYIGRDYRRLGCGTLAFNALKKGLNTDMLDLEVLYSNRRARKFWESLGFRPHSVYMQLDERPGR